MTILRLVDLTKRFDGLTAVDGCSIEVARGAIHGLIGPNGAGKTTLFNMISGLLPPSAGKILFKGEDITGLQPHEINRLGIARTFQLVSIFREMTVLENIMVGLHGRTRAGLMGAIFRTRFVRGEEERIRERTGELLNLVMPDLEEARKIGPAGNLAFGEQRLIEIARALAGRPELLLLDEPVAGMNRTEKERVREMMHVIHDMGITVLFVEHDMNLAMTVAEKITVLDHGVRIAEGTPEEVQSDPKVLEAYLGRGE